MEIEYKRTWNQSVMVVKNVNQRADYECEMLAYNEIDGILPIQIKKGEELEELCYDITGKKSLDCYLENRELEWSMLRKILEHLIHLCRELDRYLLRAERIVLRPEMIFMDNREEELYFCYHMGEKRDIKKEFSGLVEELLPKFHHENKEETEMLYALYQSTQEENYSLLRLQELFFGKKTETTEEIWEEEALQILPEVSEEAVVMEKKGKISRLFYQIHPMKKSVQQVLEKGISCFGMDKLNRKEKRWKQSFKDMASEEEGQVSNIECTKSRISQDKESVAARLIYLGNGEEHDFVLNQPVFVIGRDAEVSDGVLKSLAAGELQAKILKEKEAYYIEDMNSEHGTLVNGELLIYKNAKKLKPGDRITFADVSYRFLTFCHNSII